MKLKMNAKREWQRRQTDKSDVKHWNIVAFILVVLSLAIGISLVGVKRQSRTLVVTGTPNHEGEPRSFQSER